MVILSSAPLTVSLIVAIPMILFMAANLAIYVAVIVVWLRSTRTNRGR